jgi:hypothetical protein
MIEPREGRPKFQLDLIDYAVLIIVLVGFSAVFLSIFHR